MSSLRLDCRHAKFAPSRIRNIGSCVAQPVSARDWLDYDRNEALRRTATILEKMRIAFPFPQFADNCGRPLNLKRCKEPLGGGLTLFITETAKAIEEGSERQDFGSFMKGAPGGLYEFSIEIAAESSEQSRYLFPKLCTAVLAGNARKITVSKATELVDNNLRRAIIRSGSGLSKIRFRHGDITMEIVAERSGYMACTFSAEDDNLR